MFHPIQETKLVLLSEVLIFWFLGTLIVGMKTDFQIYSPDDESQ